MQNCNAEKEHPIKFQLTTLKIKRSHCDKIPLLFSSDLLKPQVLTKQNMVSQIKIGITVFLNQPKEQLQEVENLN